MHVGLLSRLEKLADFPGDRLAVRLQREVTSVQQHDSRIGQVALEGFGTRWNEERVVAAPHGQQLRAVCAEEGLVKRVALRFLL